MWHDGGMDEEKQTPARRETIHRMTRRCAGWNYRQRAIYQITLVQAERREPLLGRLEVRLAGKGWELALPARDKVAGCPPEAVEARVVPSALGAAIEAHWKRLGEFTPEIRPLVLQLMPDHLHGDERGACFCWNPDTGLGIIRGSRKP